MRVPKNLYTKNNRGKDIVIKSCPTSRNEADYVARTIKKLNEVDKVPLTDIVLLYRSSYITQEFEQAFAQYNIPYRIYGGQKFYQRREIKDLLAYFRVISNIKDDISFERIINVPKRNIGESSVNKYKAEAQEANLSLYEYISSIKPEDSEAPKKATINLQNLIIRIEKTRKDIENESEIFSKILEDFILCQFYRTRKYVNHVKSFLQSNNIPLLDLVDQEGNIKKTLNCEDIGIDDNVARVMSYNFLYHVEHDDVIRDAIASMEWTLFKASGTQSFITSDNPTVLNNHLAFMEDNGKTSGFELPHSQIFLPISSKLILTLTAETMAEEARTNLLKVMMKGIPVVISDAFKCSVTGEAARCPDGLVKLFNESQKRNAERFIFD